MEKVIYHITIKDTEKDQYKRFKFEADNIIVNIHTGLMGIKAFNKIYHASLDKICLIEIKQRYYNDSIILQEFPDTNKVTVGILNPYNPIQNLIEILNK